MQEKEPRPVLVIGAGGLGREVLQYALESLSGNEFTVLGYLDDQPERLRVQGIALQLPVLGDIKSHEPDPKYAYIMALGEPTIRANVTKRFLAQGAHFLTITHPLSYVSPTATVGRGCVIAPFATLGAGAVLLEFTHVHFYASSAHDTSVGPFASLSPYSVVNGQAAVGECVFLGTHATVNPTKKVGAFAKVTAGSIVYRDVPERSIADGNPAKSRPLLQFAAKANDE